MLVLKTSENNVIGAFSSVPFKFDVHGNQDCFLFSLENRDILVYDTSENDQNCWCIDRNSIRFGIEDRKSSLFIAKDFSYGTSGTSNAFGLHAPLTHSYMFQILAVEVWSPEAYE